MNKKLLLTLGLLITLTGHAQKKRHQFFAKSAISFYSPAPTSNLILDNEVSYYLNSFGNISPCGNNTSIGSCLFTNLILLFSAPEISAGFDTVITSFDSPIFQPKISFYLRPFYYTKIGVSLGTKHPSFNFGFTIPIKNIMIEFLYKNVRDYQRDLNSIEYFDMNRYQVGVMIPLN